MSDFDDVVQRIDALVDEQLTKPEPIQFYPTCRCSRPWHGLPLAGCPGTPVVGEWHQTQPRTLWWPLRWLRDGWRFLNAGWPK